MNMSRTFEILKEKRTSRNAIRIFDDFKFIIYNVDDMIMITSALRANCCRQNKIQEEYLHRNHWYWYDGCRIASIELFSYKFLPYLFQLHFHIHKFHCKIFYRLYCSIKRRIALCFFLTHNRSMR